MKLFDAVQVHLGLNHIPVIMMALAAVILGISMVIRNDSVSKTALWIFVGAGLFCIPVYLSGEGAEETVEKIAGISESMIEEHEDIAKWALAGCSITGFLSLLALLTYSRLSAIFKPALMAISIITSVILIRTAHEGGLIRHSELNTAAPAVTTSPGETERKSENEHQE
jgi:drug/metabolite transporter (DMT)-like permease